MNDTVSAAMDEARQIVQPMTKKPKRFEGLILKASILHDKLRAEGKSKLKVKTEVIDRPRPRIVMDPSSPVEEAAEEAS
jgi:hypothetical protein